ncbi:15-methylpalmitoyl-4-hydroxy-2-pyrone 4-O-methyltransferase [Mucilaginibacter mallensis]|uniref:15-methylpalmitoyl-4-hydroxy-2-pyrone 4-O-methyltransferase n=1 Tax=Mucilaginibacter mallensis TaxID=652787 RepID=A0A1H1S905_MUCMA|nr:isoprenylcysteine carboxylmethyltransferase family protein [Mucilaginibacter mallensis]SDS44457.1 15-methylpalmitoyl-4-hydroxy-2-pyrone 4-O-methyltransferase [Mucilaginibacter mallensis]
MYFIPFIVFVITQRLSELYIARRNEKWLRSEGAIEYGRGHYPYIVALHTLFIISIIVEYILRPSLSMDFVFLLLFILLLGFKFWALSSLGKYWNTKIFRVPGSGPVKKGPYKLFKHPNYFIVICEIVIIPMVFHLYYTAVIFTVLNAIMLTVRIRVENKVWAK